MANEKCDTCRLRYVCEEQAEWICKHRNYCDYSPESTTNNHVADDGKKVRLINTLPLMQNGWHLVRTGESNRFLASMSLADVPTVDSVEVVHGRWLYNGRTDKYFCSNCFKQPISFRREMDCGVGEFVEVCFSDYCPNCGAKMDGDGNA